MYLNTEAQYHKVHGEHRMGITLTAALCCELQSIDLEANSPKLNDTKDPSKCSYGLCHIYLFIY